MPDYTHIKGVYIKTPCHENWEAMTEEEKGRFCNICSKTVYDFTNATPEEFFKIYRESRGQICGRFYNEPLGFWQSTKNNAVRFFRQSKVAIIALSLGTLSTKVISANTLQPHPISITVDEDTEFVSISINIKDSYTKKLVKQDFKVTVLLKDYDLVINKVSDGIINFSIPKELVNSGCSIKIYTKDKVVSNMFLSIQRSMDIHIDFSKQALKAKERKHKKRLRQRKRKNRKWKTLGCPDF